MAVLEAWGGLVASSGLWASAQPRAGGPQQLSIPYRFGPGRHRAVILARGGEDFCDEDLRVALSIQTLLLLLDRQCSILRRCPEHTSTSLTGRELAVLRLLADGLTAAAIGHRLTISYGRSIATYRASTASWPYPTVFTHRIPRGARDRRSGHRPRGYNPCRLSELRGCSRRRRTVAHRTRMEQRGPALDLRRRLDGARSSE